MTYTLVTIENVESEEQFTQDQLGRWLLHNDLIASWPIKRYDDDEVEEQGFSITSKWGASIYETFEGRRVEVTLSALAPRWSRHFPNAKFIIREEFDQDGPDQINEWTFVGGELVSHMVNETSRASDDPLLIEFKRLAAEAEEWRNEDSWSEEECEVLRKALDAAVTILNP